MKDGIPICLPAAAPRDRTSDNNTESPPNKEAFYNNREMISKFLCHREKMEDVEHLKKYPDINISGLVMEIGSGNGMFQDEFANYLAFDYSLAALKDYIDPRHYRVCGSAEKLPFQSDCADVILTRATLEHVARPELAFAEILRVLKPGGVGYVFPAWNCQQWNCDGIPVRPFHDLTWPQKMTKLTIPLRSTLVWKASFRLIWRLFRALTYWLKPGPTELKYKSLKPNYEVFWMSDSDACASLDSFDGALFYRSRGCEILYPGPSLFRQLMMRHEPVIFKKTVK